jgi:uncharacterized protein
MGRHLADDHRAVMSEGSSDGPFVFNVAGLLTDEPGGSRTFDVVDARIELADGPALAAPISGSVRLAHENRGIIARTRLSTSLAGECARCLRPVTTPVEIRLDEEYLPSVDLTTGRPAKTEDEPEALRLTDHHEVDLGPSIRDALVLAEPIAPLDRPDCPGLCIDCGLPLDDGTHDHPSDDVDPRLAALRAFQPD